MFCSECGTESSGGTAHCRKCGAALTGDPNYVIVPVSAKNPGIAAVLSFFWCGLGQIYNGEITKGIAMVVAYAISAGMIYLLIGLLTTPILWIWGMVDAYRTAERINHEAGIA